MADEKKRPDVQTFLTDPAFQGDRELFTGLIDAHLNARMEAEKKKREEEQKAKGSDAFGFLDWFSDKTD